MPGQMLRYRAASFWSRAYASDLSLGFYTQDEVRDFAEPPRNVTPRQNPFAQQPAPEAIPEPQPEPVEVVAEVAVEPVVEAPVQQEKPRRKPMSLESILDEAMAMVEDDQ